MAFEEIFKINHNSNIYLFIQLIPVTLIATFGYAYSIKIKRNLNIYPYVYDCLINIGNKVYKISGFIDTGNQSYYKDVPIIFCDKILSKKIEKDIKRGVTVSSNVTTMAGFCSVKIIKDVNLLIYLSKNKHIHKSVVLGLTDRKLNYDLYLNFDVINGGRYAG